jgi:hypothetical protein
MPRFLKPSIPGWWGFILGFIPIIGLTQQYITWWANTCGSLNRGLFIQRYLYTSQLTAMNILYNFPDFSSHLMTARNRPKFKKPWLPIYYHQGALLLSTSIKNLSFYMQRNSFSLLSHRRSSERSSNVIHFIQLKIHLVLFYLKMHCSTFTRFIRLTNKYVRWK